LPGRAALLPTLVEGPLRVTAALTVLVLSGLSIDIWLRFPPYVRGPWNWSGLVLIALGIVLEFLGTLAFSKYGAGTPHPAAPPIWLVREGPYAYMRNPLYLARFSILLGSSVLLGSTGVLVVLLGLILFVHLVLLPREERRLSAKYGKAYEEYSSTVGRWIVLPRTRRRVDRKE
jgi:protein-S-isoprenylcysteine O-methyltransferase Ste14